MSNPPPNPVAPDREELEGKDGAEFAPLRSGEPVEVGLGQENLFAHKRSDVISPSSGDRHTQASSRSTTSWGSQSFARLRAFPLPKGQPSCSQHRPGQRLHHLTSEAGTAACRVRRRSWVGKTSLDQMRTKHCRTRLGASRCSVWSLGRDRSIEPKCRKAVVDPRAE